MPTLYGAPIDVDKSPRSGAGGTFSSDNIRTYDTPTVGVDKSPYLLRVGVETTSAILGALTVAPAISILDRAIVSNASGLEPLVPCLINGIKTMLTKPTYFFKQPAFLFIWSVYSGTYTVANNIDAFCERSSRAPFYPKFIGTAVVNVTLCNLNEVAFARMFGTGARPPMSLMSSSLFATRDSLTCLSSFCLPDIVSQHMQARCASYALERSGHTPLQ